MANFSLYGRNIDFMGKRFIAVWISVLLVVAFAISMAVQGFKFGIDFTGGTLVEVEYQQTPNLDNVRHALERGGFPGAIVQNFGTSRNVLIRIPPRKDTNSAQLSNRILTALKGQSSGDVQLRRVEFVGPQVGDDLKNNGAMAFMISIIGIFIYVLLRYEWRFAAGAIVATLHDVALTVGFFSVTQLEFDLTVLAAVLAVMGYSVNDTVVVFDRIRENFRKMRKLDTIEMMNAAINQTLSRTVTTHVVTTLAVLALLFFGGELIRNFAIAMVVGIIVGTFSSIYVASAFALMLGVSREDLLPPPKEGEVVDDRP